MLKPSTFVEHCKAEGFSPAEAMMLYDELRRFAFHSVEAKEVVDPDQAILDHMRLFALQGLSKVQTPQDFQQYLKTWEDYDSSMLKKGFSRAIQTLYTFVDRPEVIHRASGMIGSSMPEKWQAWAKLGLDWEDVKAAISYDTPALNAVSPVGVTQEQAREKLNSVIDKTKLAGFYWPFALEDTPENRWALAADLEKCSQELSQATGWGDDAIGLGQRVRIGFGMECSGLSGICHMQKEGKSYIKTSSGTHWGPLAHEWLHALDNAINNAPIPSISKKTQSEMAGAWKTMHKGLDRAAWERGEEERVRTCLVMTLIGQWEAFPLTKAAVVQALSDPELDEKAFLKRFEETHGAENPSYQKSILPVKAVQALVDLKIARSHMDEPSSLWTTFATRFREEVRVHLDAQKINYWADYFLDPMERAAHSFEATFDRKSLVSDVEPNQSMRYPLTPELSQHQLVWKRFFRAGLAWKQEINAGLVVPSNNQKPEAEPELLPMAARRSLRQAEEKSSQSSPVSFSV